MLSASILVKKRWLGKKIGCVEVNGAKIQNVQLPRNLREFATVNSFKSKADSIKQLVAENNVDTLLLNESKVYTSNATSHFLLLGKIDRVEVFFIGVRHGSYETVMVSQGDDADFVTVRLKNNREGIKLILAYGPQENDPEINRTLFYQNLSSQIEQAFLSGDSVIMVGDFNAKLGKDVVGGDVHPMSANGRLLFSLSNNYNLFVLNFSDLCKEVFTRIHNYRNKVEKSVLEYVLISEDMYSHFVSMHTDEEKLFTPWRLINKGKKFSDHCAIRFQMELNYRKRNQEKDQKKSLEL